MSQYASIILLTAKSKNDNASSSCSADKKEKRKLDGQRILERLRGIEQRGREGTEGGARGLVAAITSQYLVLKNYFFLYW